MSFYIHESIQVGSFCYDFSEKHLGISLSVIGFRLGNAPKANHIYMRERAPVYRKALIPCEMEQQAETVHIEAIQISNLFTPNNKPEHSYLLKMIDSSTTDIVSEIEEKRQLIPFGPIVALITTGFLIISFAGGASFWAYAFSLVIGALVYIIADYWDEIRKTVVIIYEFDTDIECIYQELLDAFKEIENCAKVWHIPSFSMVRNQKYHGGASRTLTRRVIKPGIGQPFPVKTNIKIPILETGKRKLVFMPNHLLVLDSKDTRTIAYKDLEIHVRETGFIESGSVPRDSNIVGHTWQYVNKNGGPDRRFKDNHRIPIVSYQEMHLKSSGGLNEIFQFSQVGPANSFREVITTLSKFSDHSGEKRGEGTYQLDSS